MSSELMARTLNQTIMEVTQAHLGIAEFPGAKHNPRILEFWQQAGMPQVVDDETAWCAGYVGGVLGGLGIPGSGRPNARSYLSWGSQVRPDDVLPGDVVVFWRGSKTSWKGHVAFFVNWTTDGKGVLVRGGNQGDQVSDKVYPIGQILGVRRWMNGDPASEGDRPILRAGNGTPDAFVQVLQQALRERGYFAGKVDGLFGPRTKTAVMSFQAAAGLATDGVVGQRTWDALMDAPNGVDDHLVRADVTAAELTAAGSRTTKTTRDGKRGAGAGVVLGTGGLIINALGEVEPQLAAAESGLQALQAFVMNNWLGILLVLGGLVAWWAFNNIEKFRVDDARTGANLSK